jgi:hypothetical protein
MLHHHFLSGQKEEFTYRDPIKGESKLLMEVRAFKNGNLHIKFSPDFMLALNVEMGRLKGWIHSAAQAAEELGEDLEKVQTMYRSSYQMLPHAASEILMLGNKPV